MKTKLTKDLEYNFINYLYDEKYELAVRECALGARKRYGIVDILSYHGKRVGNGRGKPRTRDVMKLKPQRLTFTHHTSGHSLEIIIIL